MGLAKCHFWLISEKSYYCILARAVGGRGMVTFALASAVIISRLVLIRWTTHRVYWRPGD